MLEIIKKIKLKLSGGIVHLKSIGTKKGTLLLSYTTLPFIQPDSINAHSNRWECAEMARIFTTFGYDVDVIDFNNSKFLPKKSYDYCIDISHNLERFNTFLGKNCLKIFHIPAAHWKFQNDAEMLRIQDIEKRRGFKIMPRRIVQPSNNIEFADIATILGNKFTIDTYAYAGKKIIPIPISTSHTYPSPENKNFIEAKNNFVWIGGAGMAHKGLDLVLEAFSNMPQYNLYIFGKKDPDFAEAYKKELFGTKNIHFIGMTDLASNIFCSVANRSIGIVFASCSEGGGGSVIDAMHAGLIPIVSYESSLSVEDFGIILKENTIEEIQRQVNILAKTDVQILKSRALSTWKYARTHHTRKIFTEKYTKFVYQLINKI